MQPETPMMAQPASQTLALTQNRVLRNTYLLLALSMVPTVLGAWIGVKSGFSFFAGSPVVSFILFLAIAFGSFYAIEKTKNSGWGVAILLGLRLNGLMRRACGLRAQLQQWRAADHAGSAAPPRCSQPWRRSRPRPSAIWRRWKVPFVGAVMLLVAGIANVPADPGLMIAISLIAIASSRPSSCTKSTVS